MTLESQLNDEIHAQFPGLIEHINYGGGFNHQSSWTLKFITLATVKEGDAARRVVHGPSINPEASQVDKNADKAARDAARLVIDGVVATPAQQTAAKDLLKAFVYDDWEEKRAEARGTLAQQLEHILDHGFESLKVKDDAIKVKHPKP